MQTKAACRQFLQHHDHEASHPGTNSKAPCRGLRCSVKAASRQRETEGRRGSGAEARPGRDKGGETQQGRHSGSEGSESGNHRGGWTHSPRERARRPPGPRGQSEAGQGRPDTETRRRRAGTGKGGRGEGVTEERRSCAEVYAERQGREVQASQQKGVSAARRGEGAKRG